MPNSERPNRWTGISCARWLALCVVFSKTVPVLAADRVSFNRDVRPILSDHCFHCHGPDERQRQAGLRLDLREHALKAAESGESPVVPGSADRSEVWRRIITEDEAVRMPPATTGKSLTVSQKEVLRRWISEGAEYEGHWAFVPPTRPSLPAIRRPEWAQNPIDHFVLARLDREGLAPSPEASRETLVRRLSLDLTGLPPRLEDIDAFLADTSPQAYEKLVDRLLASPHYGERMALPWLDFARYADSNGYQTDGSRFMWPWRDWVIDAFNRNLPFDQFTVAQLAGDLLPNPAPSQLTATGFNRNHRLNGEGGIIAEEWRVETVIDRVETTGLTWLALTLNCCRCHDHKYDPITQKEFYQLFAFFNNVPESGTLQGDGKNTDPVLVVPSAEQEQELKRRESEIQATVQRVAEMEKQIPQLLASWEPGFKAQVASTDSTWNRLRPTEVISAGGAEFVPQDDGTVLAQGANPVNDVYTIRAPLAAGTFSGVLLECFPDPRLPNQSLGRYPNGNFVLTRFEAELTVAGEDKPQAVTFTKAEADYSQAGWDIRFVNQKNPKQGWAVDGPTKREPRRAIFLADKAVAVPEGATLTIRMHHEAIAQHNIGRFRVSTTGLPPGTITLRGSEIPPVVREALAVAADQRTPAQTSELVKFFRANADSPLKQADDLLAQQRKQVEEFRGTLPNVMIMREGPVRETRFLIRGQYDRPGEAVTAGLPAVFPALPGGEPLNRLGLAKWMVARSNPLTARVWVNRAWERYFGTGLAKTSENFGSQAEFPSHLDLLDWLACEFMEPTVLPPVNGRAAHAWDMKALQKLIVMSATYRQESRVTPAQLQLDPDNRLLARGPRFRLSGELIRDQALAASGLLVRKIGGPSVRPYMPEGVWDETSRYGDLRNYQHDRGDGLYRRTMYTIWKRTAAPPTLLIFDAPTREACTVKRSRTNTPLQALSLLNEITFVEAARKLGERMILEGGATAEERLAYGFRLVTSRRPAPEELKVLADGVVSDLEQYRQHPESAARLIKTGESARSDRIALEELAAYALAANILLNLDEVVTRE